MLALETGWTPATIADLPARFRRATHWALYVRSIVPADGLPEPPALSGLDADAKRRAVGVIAALRTTRSILFPEE